MTQKALLMILDGWGVGPRDKSNAIYHTPTPYWDYLLSRYPNSVLQASGEDVGLPDGQMGTSEVGHLNIGAGRVVYQDLVKINKAIADGTIRKNPEVVAAFTAAKERGCGIHFMGLTSNGGVHSSLEHLMALCDIAKDYGLSKVFVHCFMDGRDTDPESGKGFVDQVERHCAQSAGVVASVVGRYYAMDRDKNWDRIKPFIPKDRVLYYMNPENTSDILLHECAAKQKGEAAFPQRLMAQATAMSEGNLPIPFASPNTDGRIIKVNTAKDTFNGNEFYSASAVNFFQRKELPPDELYDKCVPWNEMLNFGTYEEMQRVMDGGEPDNFAAAPAQHTEEQKQAEFERACEQSVPQQPAPAPQQAELPSSGFQKSPAAPGFTSTPVDAPAREFPSEQAPAANAFACPHGLRFGQDCDTSRKCCNCGSHASCAAAGK